MVGTGALRLSRSCLSACRYIKSAMARSKLGFLGVGRNGFLELSCLTFTLDLAAIVLSIIFELSLNLLDSGGIIVAGKATLPILLQQKDHFPALAHVYL